MATTKGQRQSTVIAVYPDDASAEEAVRRLQEDGISMQNLSIIGKDFQAVEKYLGFFARGDAAKNGGKVGAWMSGIAKLFVAAVFLILPGIGPVAIAGPLAAALLIGIEGALAGSAFDGLAGARRLGRLQGQGPTLRIAGQGRQVPSCPARRRAAGSSRQVPVHHRQGRDGRSLWARRRVGMTDLENRNHCPFPKEKCP